MHTTQNTILRLEKLVEDLTRKIEVGNDGHAASFNKVTHHDTVTTPQENNGSAVIQTLLASKEKLEHNNIMLFSASQDSRYMSSNSREKNPETDGNGKYVHIYTESNHLLLVFGCRTEQVYTTPEQVTQTSVNKSNPLTVTKFTNLVGLICVYYLMHNNNTSPSMMYKKTKRVLDHPDDVTADITKIIQSQERIVPTTDFSTIEGF